MNKPLILLLTLYFLSIQTFIFTMIFNIYWMLHSILLKKDRMKDRKFTLMFFIWLFLSVLRFVLITWCCFHVIFLSLCLWLQSILHNILFKYNHFYFVIYTVVFINFIAYCSNLFTIANSTFINSYFITLFLKPYYSTLILFISTHNSFTRLIF